MSNAIYWPDQAAAVAYSMKKQTNIPISSTTKKVPKPKFTGDWQGEEWQTLSRTKISEPLFNDTRNKL